MTRVRLTAAQAAVRFLSAQQVELDGCVQPFFGGVSAIFGHGNVGGLGEALWSHRARLPTLRGHNEQAMALAAIAFAKQTRRRRAMICTTSVGPGATNLLTAAALAHVNRLPILLLPGDVFASRAPDPVLQQLEDFGDGTASANDAFRSLSRYFDRITRPEQLLTALPRAMSVLTDPAECGPVTLAFPQDVQAEAWDWPEAFFASRIWRVRRPQPDPVELDALVAMVRAAQAPLIVAGGGVLYSGADAVLAAWAERAGVPVGETQAGKGALPWTDRMALGGVGVSGSTAANAAAREADLIVGIGTRLADFTTGSRSLFSRPGRKLVQVNVQPYDAGKHDALPVVGDALAVLEALTERLAGWSAPSAWTSRCVGARDAWLVVADDALAPSEARPPSDAQVLGAVWRAVGDDAVVVAAAGGLPGELHKLWRPRRPDGYHVEYGYSCMGYEIAGGLGVALSAPERPVVVLVGDGSYLMMNSEIATAVALGVRFVVVLLDNRGYGCIDRLQRGLGSPSFNNRLDTAFANPPPPIDFAAHAASLGAWSEHVADPADLPDALARALAAGRVAVVVVETDPAGSTAAGGAWWDVPPPAVSERAEVRAARAVYETATRLRDGEPTP